MTKSPIWRPYTQEKISPPSLKLKGASGSFLVSENGREIFDGISSWWLITHGHCQPEIVQAVQRQAARLDQVTFANFTHEPGEELADLLVQITPNSLTRVFLSDNGSTAVEVALKMALQSWQQRGAPHKNQFLAFEGAYHGDTVGAMSVSGDNSFNLRYRKCLFEVLRAKHPTNSQAPAEEFTKSFEHLLEENHERLAGVIVEPLLQGAAGMIAWPAMALQKIAELCRTYGIYLIFDEVMTGFGRTGKMFALDRVGVAPDLLCLSKGLTGGTLPLAATLASEEIYESFFHDDRTKTFFHGHSFTGNPISCAAAVANIQLCLRRDFLENVACVERVQREELERMACAFPISDPRTCGTVAAFEIDSGEKKYLNQRTKRLTAMALEKDLFLRPLGNTIYLMPPYCSLERDLRWAWEKIRETLSDLI